jgi:hypothetical protein
MYVAAVKLRRILLWAADQPKELAERCFGLYERIRPEILEGVKGWGAKGDLDLRLIEALAKRNK